MAGGRRGRGRAGAAGWAVSGPRLTADELRRMVREAEDAHSLYDIGMLAAAALEVADAALRTAAEWAVSEEQLHQQRLHAAYAERDAARAALAEALDEMTDMLPYVPAYFATKWDYQSKLERLRAALTGEEPR